jgi:hypothetical protein
MRLPLLLVLLAVMIWPAASAAGPETTAPSKYVLVSVLISDKGIVVRSYATTSTNKFVQDLTVIKIVPRGDYLSFNVLNLGKKLHNFTILGKKTPSIKPGGKAHLFLAAMVRGNFLYQSTLDRGKSFRGHIAVG